MIERLRRQADLIESRFENANSIKKNIKRTFVNGKFNKENWMGGDVHTFRDFAIENATPDEDSFTWSDEDDVVKLVVNRHCVWENDFFYSTISVFEWTNKGLVTSVYTMVIYKSRGRVEEIKKNGEWITEKEFVELLDIIAKTGEDIWVEGKCE